MRFRPVLCAVLAACATTGSSLPPPPPGPPPTFVLDLAIDNGAVGVVVRQVCNGTLSGTLEIVRPDGSRGPITVRSTPVMEETCENGLGSKSSCMPLPRSWIALPIAPDMFAAPGVYMLSGKELALSCAPATTRVTPVRAFVASAGALPVLLPDDAPVPVIVAAPLPSQQAPKDTALDVRKRMAATQHRADGRVEVLLIPQRPVARGSRAWTTAWGTLHLAPRAPAAILDHERGPTWVESRASSTVKPTPLVLDGKPHIVALDLEDGVTGQGPVEALRAGQSGGVIASTSRILDGDLDVQKALDDGLARWRAHVANQGALEADLAANLDTELGAQRSQYTTATSQSSEYRPSWSSADRQLVVRYVAQHLREARARSARTVRVCPPNRPPSACRDMPHRSGTIAKATFALEVVYDSRGVVVRELALPPVFEIVPD